MKKTYVEIVETETETVIKRMGPMHPKKAERVEAGVDININHERFFSRIVTESSTTASDSE